jgi:small conductance mechanosensitive channel
MDTESASNATQQVMDTAVALVADWGLSVIGAITLLIVGRMAAGLLQRGVRRQMERAKVDPALHPFIAGLTYYVVLIVVGISVLGLFGVQTTSLVAVVGAAGLAIGLALQGTLSNFASGVMLLIFRPIGLGDYVEISGVGGSVAEIGIFTTTLDTPDNVRIIIPNSGIYGAVIKNYSANATRRIDMVMGIGYGDDINVAIDVIEKIVRAHPNVLEFPETTIAVSELGDSSVNIVVRPWCNRADYWVTRFALTKQLKEGLEAGGCSIPFPQRDLHVIDMPNSQGA